MTPGFNRASLQPRLPDLPGMHWHSTTPSSAMACAPTWPWVARPRGPRSSSVPSPATRPCSAAPRCALWAPSATSPPAAGRWLLGQLDDERLRSGDLLTLLAASSDEPETRQIAFDWMVANYERLVSGSGIFVASTLPSLPSGFCSVEAADRVEAALRPMVLKHERGALELDRSVEQVRSCGLLRAHRQADLEKLFR